MQAGQVSLKRLRVTRAIQTQNYQQNPPTSTVDLQVGYRYDTEGRVTCVQYPTTGRYATDPGLFYCYSYDSMSRIAGLSTYPGDPNYYWNSPTSAITGVTYGPANEMQQIQYAGGAIESRQYNSLLQMTRLTAPGAFDVSYNFPAGQNNGKITSQTDNISGETVQYAYDSLNRLVQAYATSHSWGQSFSYDPYGNLTAKNVLYGSAPSLSVVVDQNTNRVVDPQYVYNASGLLTDNRYSYDAEGRLYSSQGSPSWPAYMYGPRGERIWTGVYLILPSVLSYTNFGNVTTYPEQYDLYGIDGVKLGSYALSAYGTSGGVNPPPPFLFFAKQESRVYFAGRLMQLNGASVHPDRLGSLGTFYPYGEARNPASNPAVFATYRRDANNGEWDYAINRYYSNAWGRFMMPDPYEAGNDLSGGTGSGDPRAPLTWNRYTYVVNDPTNYIDPSGLQGVNVAANCQQAALMAALVGGSFNMPCPGAFDAFGVVASGVGAVNTGSMIGQMGAENLSGEMNYVSNVRGQIGWVAGDDVDITSKFATTNQREQPSCADQLKQETEAATGLAIGTPRATASMGGHENYSFTPQDPSAFQSVLNQNPPLRLPGNIDKGHRFGLSPSPHIEETNVPDVFTGHLDLFNPHSMLAPLHWIIDVGIGNIPGVNLDVGCKP